MAISVENKVKLGVGFIIVVLLANALMSFRATRDLIEHEQWVSHSHQVIHELEVVLSTVKDAETGERGFIITGSPEYLEPYHSAIAQIDGHVEKLKQLTADNPDQQALIPVLQKKLAERLDLLKRGFELRNALNNEGARQLIASGAGRRLMDELRGLIDRMEAEENGLLNQRIAESRISQRDTILTFLTANLLAVALLLATASVTVSGIRARKRAEDALSEQRNLLQVTLSSIADGVIACDINGRITFLNPVAELITGWKDAEAKGQPLPKVFRVANEETRRHVDNPALRAIAEGVIVGLANHTLLIRKDGTEIPIDDAGAPIKTANGMIFGAVLIFRDITERHKADHERARLLASEHAAREVAESASRSKDEFLAILSHELRTPLTAVFGWTQVLKNGSPDAATREKALGVIDRNLRAQTQLIDDLLNVSQIITGKLQLNCRLISPLVVTRAAIDTVRPSAEAKQITISLRAKKEILPPISADIARMQQIVWNLLSNAVKFTPKGGTICVEIAQVGSELKIIVRDNGEGISRDFLPLVFNRFSQADASRTRAHGGMGLGLALVRQLMELHGGTVEAVSDGAGTGSTFTLSFPLPGVRRTSSKIPPESRNNPIGPANSLQNVRVLLVEDEPDTREIIAETLQQLGATVVQASNAANGLREFEAARPDILISDIGMPDADGYHLLAMIQAQCSVPPPALALTAFATAQDKEHALCSGFQAHMSKPIELSELVSRISELVARVR